jgi:hypothetical protein
MAMNGDFTRPSRIGFVLKLIPWSFRFCSMEVKERLVLAVSFFVRFRSALNRVLYLFRLVFEITPPLFKYPTESAYRAMLSPPLL